MISRLLTLSPVYYWVALIVLVAVIPWLSSDHLILLLVIAGIYGITALGLDMLIGYAGQISFGHAGFVGIGAYGSGLLSLNFGWPPVVTILLAALGAAAVGWGLGLIIFRLRGHYLAMATFAFGQIVFLLTGTLEITGGSVGLFGIAPLSLFGFDIVTPNQAFYVIWPLFCLFLFVALRIKHSRPGRALRALRHEETAAAASGINVHLMKTNIFAISAFMAGISGGLFVHYFTVASAESFNVHLSILLMAIVVVGGMGTAWGTILGVVLLTVLPGLALTSTKYNGLFYGIIYVLVFLVFPAGLAGGLALIRERKIGLRTRQTEKLGPSASESC